MTEIEQKALALVNEVLAENGMNNTPHSRLPTAVSSLVLLRAIEQHEQFKREVSERDERLGEALYGLSARLLLAGFFENKEGHTVYERVVEVFGKPFILPKTVDPLVEAVNEAWGWRNPHSDVIENLRAALAKRGLEVREIEQ